MCVGVDDVWEWVYDGGDVWGGCDVVDVCVLKGNGGVDEFERVGDVYGYRENYGGVNDWEYCVLDCWCVYWGVLDVCLGCGW